MGDEVGFDPGLILADEAAKRLQRSRCTALSRVIAERRQRYVAETAASLVELLGADVPHRAHLRGQA